MSLNVPNALTGLRLAVSPGLAVLALAGRADLFLYLFLALEATDWLDGKLAVLLDQRTELGSRLDSVADLVMYALLLGGLAVLEGDALLGEWAWIASVPLTYAASWIASWAKFGQMPAYHTYSAKASYFLVIVATAALLAGSLVWPVRVAAAAVAVGNLEAVAITAVLEEPRSDVPSLLTVIGEDRA